jgi:hypothetical protein
MEFLFDSRKACSSMRCGHTIHVACLEQLMRSQYKCPLCSASLLDPETMQEHYRAMDQEIAATQMPDEYRNTRVQILCNDCHQRSETAWHVLGLKCMAPLAEADGGQPWTRGPVSETGGPGAAAAGSGAGSDDAGAAGPAAGPADASTGPTHICGSYNTRRVR